MMKNRTSAGQKWQPAVQIMVNSEPAGEGTALVRFRVPTPDSRLRVKIDVLFVPDTGSLSLTPDITTAGATLWLVATEDDRSGMSGATIPVTNIEGTLAAPTAIPAAPGLLGYSREFVTAADNIEGTFKCGTSATGGYWVLQTRYQPDSVRFTDEEWDDLVSKCNPQMMTRIVHI